MYNSIRIQLTVRKARIRCRMLTILNVSSIYPLGVDVDVHNHQLFKVDACETPVKFLYSQLDQLL